MSVQIEICTILNNRRKLMVSIDFIKLVQFLIFSIVELAKKGRGG